MPVTVKFDPTSTSKQSSIIPDATPYNDGVMSKDQAAALHGSTFNGPLLQIYVNASAGSDTNDGLSAATAVKTFAKAASLIPLTWNGAVQVIFAAGTYAFPPGTGGGGFLFLPAGFGGEDTSCITLIGELQNAIPGTLVSTNTDATGFTLQTVGSFVPGAYEGNFLLITSGPFAGFQAMIAENDANSFTVNSAFPGQLNPGTSFQVLKPAVVITYDAAFIDEIKLIAMKNLKFQGNSANSFLGFSVSGTFVVAEAVEIDGGGGTVKLATQNALLFTASFAGFINPDPFDSRRFPSGGYFHNGNFDVTRNGQHQFYSMFRNATVRLQQQSRSILNAPNMKNTSVTVEQSMVQMFGEANGNGFGGKMSVNKGSNPLVNLKDCGSLDMYGMRMEGSTTDAILAQKASHATLGTVTSNGALPNAGAGVHVKECSSAVIDSGGGTTAVTGTLGDTEFSVTTVPTIKTYAALRTPDGSGIEGFTDPYLNRVEVDQ